MTPLQARLERLYRGYARAALARDPARREVIRKAMERLQQHARHAGRHDVLQQTRRTWSHEEAGQ